MLCVRGSRLLLFLGWLDFIFVLDGRIDLYWVDGVGGVRCTILI